MTRGRLRLAFQGLLIGAAIFALYAAVCWELDRITPFIYVVF